MELKVDEMSEHYIRFEQDKKRCLEGIDMSKKGSIDAPIKELVQYINSCKHCFTTSSCSGRTILFQKVSDFEKKGCKWLHVTHEQACSKPVLSALADIQDDVYFKFEPFVLHVQCLSLAVATKLHAVAIASGFRNSGISIGRKGKVIMAVRSTHSMEVPVAIEGKKLVSDEYISQLVIIANNRMTENQRRIERFFETLKGVEYEDLPDTKDNFMSWHKSKKKIKRKVDHLMPKETITTDSCDIVSPIVQEDEEFDFTLWDEEPP